MALSVAGAVRVMVAVLNQGAGVGKLNSNCQLISICVVSLSLLALGHSPMPAIATDSWSFLVTEESVFRSIGLCRLEVSATQMLLAKS